MIKVNNKDTRTTPMADWSEKEENSNHSEKFTFPLSVFKKYIIRKQGLLDFDWFSATGIISQL